MFTIPVAFYTSNLLQFSEKKFTLRIVNEHRFSVNAIGEYRVEKKHQKEPI